MRPRTASVSRSHGVTGLPEPGGFLLRNRVRLARNALDSYLQHKGIAPVNEP